MLWQLAWLRKSNNIQCRMRTLFTTIMQNVKCNGSKISGIGSNLLEIEGVSSLNGCKHRVLPDMIEIGSFIGLAAITKSEITIKMFLLKILELFPIHLKSLVLNLNFVEMIFLFQVKKIIQ